jgi:outer membrane biosynthesis protein TonB
MVGLAMAAMVAANTFVLLEYYQFYQGEERLEAKAKAMVKDAESGAPTTEAKPPAKAEPKPEAKPEAKTEAKPEAKPDAKTEAKTEPKPEAKPADAAKPPATTPAK